MNPVSRVQNQKLERMHLVHELDAISFRRRTASFCMCIYVIILLLQVILVVYSLTIEALVFIKQSVCILKNIRSVGSWKSSGLCNLLVTTMAKYEFNDSEF
uniref:Uncharacterized protein n=1 Tax=Opuntia streptacantha TaxID=393608 RepID=A0A7C8Z9D1_OPUST